MAILSINLDEKVFVTPKNKRNKQRKKKLKRIIN